MRIGDHVTCHAPDGSTCPAVVSGVGGSTPSLWKILNVRSSDVEMTDLAHLGDQSLGDGAWSFPDLAATTPADQSPPAIAPEVPPEAPHTPEEPEDQQGQQDPQ